MLKSPILLIKKYYFKFIFLRYIKCISKELVAVDSKLPLWFLYL